MKRTPLRSRSPKKTAKDRDYRKVRRWVADRADGLCEAQISGVCTVRGEHAHHILRRSQCGTDEPSNLLWCCAFCHDHIHRNVAWAIERGFLRKAEVAS